MPYANREDKLAYNRRPERMADARIRAIAWQYSSYDSMFGFDAGTTQWAVECATVCALCGEPFGDTRATGKAVDHNHSTNKFRGIIHLRCNAGIGLLQDSEERCLQAAAYLRV